ncbi:MFS transporter [Caballeronia mineralivorans]|jgi:AAHS family 4-hydroxybenzoate transporter-like MFS transporter|uniref:MFS transporter n=1 Tax=Caballeronia mineralivorans TaxID=2010198 RepID=UPI002AFFFC2C|nr:MFS transporter [Caballeronia mineralivorans]MEA3101019.1 transporter, family, 4-hydroxybenzoate transporter [Caballeronia mineralivorans]
METGNRIDVAAVIDGAKFSAFQWRVFILMFIVILFDGYDTQAIAFVAPAISVQWKLPAASFGPIFSAGLAGTVLGAISFGMLADRIGRRWLVIISVAMFGCLTWVCSLADSYTELLIYRLLAGIGLGGALVNFLAVASEYAPERLRNTVVTISMWGFPLGAVIGGSFAGPMIERYGWKSIFYLGALLPLLCVPLLIGLLPESVRYLALSPHHRAKIASVLSKIDPQGGFRPDDAYFVAEPSARRGSVIALFRNGFGWPTVLLWFTLFASLVMTYCLINWIPSLLRQVGMPIRQAVLGTVMINFAAIIGSLAVVRFAKRHTLTRLAGAYVIGAAAVAGIGLVGNQWLPIMTCIFLAGFFVIGAQLAVTAYITGYYPTTIRGTGVGWAQGVGRFGSLIGPLAGGIVLSMTAQPSQMFLYCAIPPLAAALALLALARLTARRSMPAQVTLRTSPPPQ